MPSPSVRLVDVIDKSEAMTPPGKSAVGSVLDFVIDVMSSPLIYKKKPPQPFFWFEKSFVGKPSPLARVKNIAGQIKWLLKPIAVDHVLFPEKVLRPSQLFMQPGRHSLYYTGTVSQFNEVMKSWVDRTQGFPEKPQRHPYTPWR